MAALGRAGARDGRARSRRSLARLERASALEWGLPVRGQYGDGQFERLLDDKQLLFYREGATAHGGRHGGALPLPPHHGKTDAGDSPDNLTQRLLAHVPLLLHDDPHSVLVVGLGTGITLGAALLHPIDHVDVMEVSPEVVEASRFFAEANGRAWEICAHDFASSTRAHGSRQPTRVTT
jgi:hypothetical protein